MKSIEKLHTQSSVGERLRWLREKNGLTLEHFGLRIGFDKSYLSRLESGKNKNPSVKFLRKVTETFHVNGLWLEVGQGDPGIACATPNNPSGLDWEEIQRDMRIVDVVRILMQDLKEDQIAHLLLKIGEDKTLDSGQKRFWTGIILRAALVERSGDPTRMLLGVSTERP